MCEVVKGNESELHKYLSILPDDLDFFYYWDQVTLNECQDEELLKLANDLKLEVNR